VKLWPEQSRYHRHSSQAAQKGLVEAVCDRRHGIIASSETSGSVSAKGKDVEGMRLGLLTIGNWFIEDWLIEDWFIEDWFIEEGYVYRIT
jgi:hypothetical protein